MSLPPIYDGGGSSSEVTEAKVFDKIKIVKTASDMPSSPSSDTLYWVDYAGLLEVNPITVPSGGLFIKGHNPNLTGIGSTADNFTLFSGGGNVFADEINFEVTGANSKVFDLADPTGTNAIELTAVNLNNCASLGELDGFRQFSMVNVGLFGGKPDLTLSGSMNGIYIDTALVAGLDDDFTGSIFTAGTGLSLSSRFRSNMRLDLPSGASFCDFAPSNFADSSLCQINGGQFSRDGVVNSGDNNFFPNLDPEDLVCEWRDNNGLRNTHEGGRMEITTEATTSIASSGTAYDIAGTWTASELQHFSMPSNGNLKNDGKNPQEYAAIGEFIIDGGPNDVLNISLVKWSEVDQAFSTVKTFPTQVFSNNGPRDLAILNFYYTVNLEVDDYVKIQVSNETNTTDVTLEVGSYLQLTKR